eukprot:maker-scaffold324_size206069-snap-gene-1.28 protein:Tk12284 transcript:maker-scaffold324_size206069-snap-gene-1.28-mRNA-1 annotation:"grip1-associated protein 1 isoform x2"
MALLDPEDFQRLQESLLELKTQNYQLQANGRRQNNALGDAEAKIATLERELAKAQKAVQKSKKATEVQQLVQENESLRRKLVCQEEEFRDQNQTLLTELSNLVTTNEKLEQEIKVIQSNEASGNTVTPPLTAELHDLRNANVKLQDQMEEVKREHEVDLMKLRHNVQKANAENAKMKRQMSTDNEPVPREDPSEASSSSGRDSPELCQVNNSARVSFHRESLAGSEDPLIIQGKINPAAQEELQAKITSLEVENNRLVQENHELAQTREKSSLESALKVAEEDKNTLQTQLQNGFEAFEEFKRRKATELQGMEQEISSLKEKISQNERIAAESQSELRSKGKVIHDLEDEIEAQIAESQRVQARLESATRDLNIALEEKGTLQSEYEETIKLSEKRKKTLDEMAISIQNKVDEFSAKIDHLEIELRDKSDDLESSIQAESETREIITRLERVIDLLKSANGETEEKLKDLQAHCEALQGRLDQEVAEIQSDKDLSIRTLDSEHQMVMRSLNTQVEIANAQRSEFEEKVAILKQELEDLHEDKKISEKKGSGLLKDLKRQLLNEKQRNEKLQEKMQEVFTDPQPAISMSAMHREVDPDRTSISSWSMMSGQDGTSTPQPGVTSPVSNASTNGESAARESPPRAVGISPVNRTLTTDSEIYLGKIQNLQEERLVLEEKNHMLQASAAAMADDLVRKSAIIQYYCMEGRISVPTTPTTVPNNEKLKNNMKKMMNRLLVHPDAEIQADMQRMQNMLEETLTKNMQLQKHLENLGQEVVRLSKTAADVSLADRQICE